MTGEEELKKAVGRRLAKRMETEGVHVSTSTFLKVRDNLAGAMEQAIDVAIGIKNQND